MTTRRTYHQHRQRNQEEADTDVPPIPPQPTGGGGTVLRTILTVAVSAVVGAVAVDFYRRFFSKNRNDGGDDEMQGHQMIGPMGALPGATSIMPMPMPLPIPWPMGGGYGFGAPQAAPPGYRDERPLTKEQELELQRLKTEEAKAKAMSSQWEAWENEDID